jgi:hypothetical protein
MAASIDSVEIVEFGMKPATIKKKTQVIKQEFFITMVCYIERNIPVVLSL